MSSPELPPEGEVLLYQTEDGRTRIECRFEMDTLWLTQALMAELFQTTPQNITLHIKAIYDEQGADEAATCKEFLQVRLEGAREVRRVFKFFQCGPRCGVTNVAAAKQRRSSVPGEGAEPSCTAVREVQP